MTLLSYILSSARHYARSHVGLLIGVTLASAILSGSLLVGDSVKASLRRVAELRLGQVQTGVVGGERWFTEKLARDTQAVSLVLASGAVVSGDGQARVNAAQVLGVDQAFWSLSPSERTFDLKDGEVLINTTMATKLSAKVGDQLVVRMEKPSALSRDAPLSGSTNTDIALRRTIAGIVSAEDFGDFQLQASQLSPATVFIALKDVQIQLEMEGRCNAAFSREQGASSRALAMQRRAGLADYALRLKRIEKPSPQWEVSTDRVFLDDPLAAKIMSAFPAASGVMTYLVNGITSAKGGTPYSMVTASRSGVPPDSGPAGVPPAGNSPAGGTPAAPVSGGTPDLRITQWLADDQKLVVGDEITLRYFVVGIGRELKEEKATFKVGGILAMNDPLVTREWTPEFPGVSDVDNCSDWDPGFPMDNKAIRDQDEKYWDDYKGTPKAFISLTDGQRLWANRFGKVTAMRLPISAGDEASVTKALLDQLKLSDAGLVMQDFKGQASAAAKGSVDFGGLFIGLSLFLIVAAMVFAALLFLFLIERRASQMGLMLAVGWSPAMVRKALLWEAGVIALVGSALGLVGGVGYTKAALAGLNGAWGGATAGLPLIFAMSPVTLCIAFVASFAVAMGTLWWITRKLLTLQAVRLLAGNFDEGRNIGGRKMGTSGPEVQSSYRQFSYLPHSPLALGIALLITATRMSNPQAVAGLFFGSGMMFMIAGLLYARRWMRGQHDQTKTLTSLQGIGWRSVVRRPGRSLAVMAMMAAGIFLVVAVNAFRLGAPSDTAKRDSGTGGFTLIGESALPVYEDLNTKRGRDAFGLDEADLSGASILPFRVRPGDDASCLNLNRAQVPQLVGVNTQKLADLKAFAFARGGWSDLKSQISNLKSEVPAVVDQATAMWGLQKGVGDVIEYDLGEGKTLRVRIAALLAGSVLQGKLIIDEAEFIKAMPDVAGYRMFLLDAPKPDETKAMLTRQLESRGLALESTSARLAAFSAVQNTYIGIFTVLGGLGVLLGTAGIGVLILRHVLERRGELGLMQAMGFTPRALRGLVMGEHAALMLAGLVLGAITAAIAVGPSLRRSAQDLPLPFIVGLLVSIVGCGMLVCWMASAWALRGRLVDAIREE